MKRKRTIYQRDYKVMIVELIENGQTVSEISREYGLNDNMVRRWRKEFNDKSKPSFTGQGNLSLNDKDLEIRNLKKQLREAKLERDILKKAVGIFSKSDKTNINL